MKEYLKSGKIDDTEKNSYFGLDLPHIGLNINWKV